MKCTRWTQTQKQAASPIETHIVVAKGKKRPALAMKAGLPWIEVVRGPEAEQVVRQVHELQGALETRAQMRKLSVKPRGRDNMRGAATMSKWKQGYYHLLDAVSGGRVYHPRWMSKLGIPPVPAWTVVWFFDLQNWCRGRG